MVGLCTKEGEGSGGSGAVRAGGDVRRARVCLVWLGKGRPAHVAAWTNVEDNPGGSGRSQGAYHPAVRECVQSARAGGDEAGRNADSGGNVLR